MLGRGRNLIIALILALCFASVGVGAMEFDIPADSAILVDWETGQVLFAKNEKERMPAASLTKIMTMLLVMEAVERGQASLDDTVHISRHASSMGGSQVFLAPGESFTLQELLQAVAIASGNDASVAVAEHVAGTEANFVQMMNRRASELGMDNTTFVNASGLPTGSAETDCLTTVEDVALMSRELITSFPEVLQWTSVWQQTFREGPRPFVLTNTNRLIRTYPGADGLKTGFTNAAGYCLSATAQQGDRRLISVVMGTESDEARREYSTRLLDYGFRAFEKVFAAVEGEPVGSLPVPEGRQEQLRVLAGEDFPLLVPRGSRENIETRIEAKSGLQAPVRQGEEVGQLVVTQQGREVGRIPVVAAADVERANIFIRLFRWISAWLKGLF